MDTQKLTKGNLTFIVIDKKSKVFYITQTIENAELISNICSVNTISLNNDDTSELITLIKESKKAKYNTYVTATDNDPVGETLKEQLTKYFSEAHIFSMDCHMLRSDRTVKDFKGYWEKHGKII